MMAIDTIFAELSDPWRDPCFLLSVEGLIVASNKAGATMFRVPREELVGCPLQELVLDSVQHLESYILTCAGNRQQVPGSLSCLDRDGKVARYRCYGYLVRSQKADQPLIFLRCRPAQEAFVKFTSLNRQLAEQLRAHRELKDAHARLRTVLDSLQAIVYVADMETYEILFINKFGRDLFGDITGKICWQTIQADQAGPCPFCTNKYLLDPQGQPADSYSWEFQNSKSGSWYLINDQAIQWVDGRLVRLEIATDITGRKEAELKVREAKERWELTFNAIDEVITIHDEEMRIVQANQAAADLFAVEPQQLVGRYCYEVFRGESRPCPDCPEVIAREDMQPHEAVIRHDNLEKIYEVSSAPLMSPEGELQGFVHIAKDITQQQLVENQLRQAQKMEAMGTLAGGIAHDFNNILTPILGYTDMALTRIAPDTTLASHLEQVKKAASRAKDLVQQILSFSRKADYAKKPLEPHLVIKEALKLLRASLPTTIEFRQDIAQEGCTVYADPTQIHQIIMNLCTNAYHAMMETGGVLGIALKAVEVSEADRKVVGLELKPGSYVQLTVSDSGCGMDRKILEKIFDPYFSTKKRGEGTGLGLSVVHGIVKSFHGHITVYSEPGQGTTFHVYLPRVRAAGAETAVESHEPVPTGTERILVVDDEEAISSLLRLRLEGMGYHVVVRNDSVAALELIKEHPEQFDLIITDMTMPHLTGLELAQEVMTCCQDLPIIMCTGFSHLINKDKANSLGIREFLMKPVSLPELATAIRRALQK